MAESIGSEPGRSHDRYARLAQGLLAVPAAVVSMVDPLHQVFAGAVGLPEPERETALTDFLRQHVVAEKSPLIVADARTDSRLAGNVTIEELGVVACAAWPLVDDRDVTVGSLCAIDSRPRDWMPTELQALSDLAAGCSAEIGLHSARLRAAAAQQQARALLNLSEALSGVAEVADVATAAHAAARSALRATHTGLWLLDETSNLLRYVAASGTSWPQAERRMAIPAGTANPVATAVAQRRRIMFTDSTGRLAAFPRSAPVGGETSPEATAYLPLLISGDQLGCLAAMWDQPRTFTDEDVALLEALARYTAQAVQRAQLLSQRQEAALTLQRAMLSELPQPDHLELEARYLPAAAGDLVGGDWYDALMLPPGNTALVVGDVSGHNLTAAAQMGQARNILRSLAWNQAETPATIVQRLDHTLTGLRTQTLATIVFGQIEQTPHAHRAGTRLLRWANAGHPPPLLLHADGHTEFLAGDPEPLLGVLPDRIRNDHTAQIPAGSTLLLYTDGLIETRTEDIDAGQRRLADTAHRYRALPLPRFLDAVIRDVAGDHPEDDIAVLAVRFHP